MVWDRTNRPVWLRYTSGVLVVLVAAVIRLQFLQVLEFRVTFVTFYPAVAFAALYGGFGPGLAATIVSAAIADYFWIMPVGQFAIPEFADKISFGVFLFSGALISYLAEATFRAQAQAAHKAEEQLKLAGEREKAEEERKKLTQLRLDLIDYAGDHTMGALLSKALDEIGAFVESPIGFYHFVESDQKTLSLQQWSTRTLMEFCKAERRGRHYSIDLAGVWVDCVRERKPVIHNDYKSLEHRKGMPEGHAEVVRELVVPVMREGKVVAILGVGNKPVDYTEKDAETVAYLADVTWEIVRQKRNEEELQQAKEEAERRAREIEAIMEAAPATIWISRDTECLSMTGNQATYELLGLPAGSNVSETAACGERLTSFRAFRDGVEIPPNELPVQMAAKGKEIQGEELELIFEDGKSVFIFGNATPLHDPAGDVYGAIGAFIDITERKKAEEQLRQNEITLRTVLDQLPSGVTVRAVPTGALILANSRGREIAGNLAGDIAQFSRYRGFYPDGLKYRVEDWPVVRSMTTGELVDSEEIEYERIDGAHFMIRMSSAPIRDLQGQIIMSACVFDDITRRKRAEQELRDSEALLAESQKISHLGSWSHDLRTDRLVWSDEIYRIFGLEPQEFASTYEAFLEAVHPEDREAVDIAYSNSLMEGQSSYDIEHRVVCKHTGEIRYVQEKCIHQRDAAGTVFRSVGMVLDITDRKMAEDALRESEERLRLFIEHAPASLAMFDRQMRYLSHSLRWISDHKLVDRDIRGLSHYEVFPEISERWKEVHRRSLAGEVLKADNDRFERADGSVQWVRWETRPWYNAKGDVAGILIFSEDITEWNQMMEELRKSHDELELRVKQRTADLELANEKLRLVPSMLLQAQENERQRLAMELHDSIGQTLAGLKYRIEYVISNVENQGVTQVLQLLHDYVPILQRSIDETRAIYMGLKPMVLAELGILAALQWYRREILELYPNQHIELDITVKEQDIPEDLKIGIFRITQEALNNAFKHGKSEWVDVRLTINNDAIELVISDDGIGMDPDYITESSNAKSLGIIGMRERVELTGGKFAIESAPGEGTTIQACWPLKSMGNFIEENQ